MLSFVANGLGDAIVALADRPRRVWLRNATKVGLRAAESVLNALRIELFKGISEFGSVSSKSKSEVKRIFERYGKVNVDDNERYWTEEDLASFLEHRFKKPSIRSALNRSIPVLWRCFHFHAYFPFPELSFDRLDLAAFQRAMALLASDGASRLGCDWFGDYGMHRDGNYDLALYGVGRILGSLANPVTSPEGLSRNRTAQEAQMEDLLDVLTLVHPPSVPYGSTTQDELRGHARRILSSTESYRFSIPRGDFLSLFTLLLSQTLDDRLVAASSEGLDEITPERLANAVVRRFAPNEDSDIDLNICGEKLSHYLINLPSQMSLIFNGGKHEIFGTALKRPDATSPTPYIQYLGLLNPPYTTLNKFSQRARRTLQNPELKLTYSATSTTLSASDFASAIIPIQNSSLLLLRGNISSNLAPTTPVTFVIWIPFPWKVDNEKAPEISKISTSHGLFQLEPTLQVLRPICPWSPAANMINLDTEADTLRFGKEAESGLLLNFETSIAVLHYVPKPSTTEHADIEINEYRDVGEAKEDWKTTMHVQSFGLYESQGAPPPTQEELGEKYIEAVRLKRYREAEAERLVREAGPKVTGEELKRRIQGIGPREIGEGQMSEAREK